MTVLKSYDGSSWQPVAVGAQGLTGTQGTTGPQGIQGIQGTTPSGGGMTLLSTTTLSGASTTVSGISQSYKNLYIEVIGVTNASNGRVRFAPNNNVSCAYFTGINNTTGAIGGSSTTYGRFNLGTPLGTSSENNYTLTIYNYTTASSYINYQTIGAYVNSASSYVVDPISGSFVLNDITSIVFSPDSGSFTGGTVRIYGVN